MSVALDHVSYVVLAAAGFQGFRKGGSRTILMVETHEDKVLFFKKSSFFYVALELVLILLRYS